MKLLSRQWFCKSDSYLVIFRASWSRAFSRHCILVSLSFNCALPASCRYAGSLLGYGGMRIGRISGKEDGTFSAT